MRKQPALLHNADALSNFPALVGSLCVAASIPAPGYGNGRFESEVYSVTQKVLETWEWIFRHYMCVHIILLPIGSKERNQLIFGAYIALYFTFLPLKMKLFIEVI
jgi:hypothetical protein